jgi:hypothetical protein
MRILPLIHCHTDMGTPRRPVPALNRRVNAAIDNPSEPAMM